MLFLNKKFVIFGILFLFLNVCFSVENKIISNIVFEGNKKIKSDILETVIFTKKKNFLDENKIQ